MGKSFSFWVGKFEKIEIVLKHVEKWRKWRSGAGGAGEENESSRAAAESKEKHWVMWYIK